MKFVFVNCFSLSYVHMLRITFHWRMLREYKASERFFLCVVSGGKERPGRIESILGLASYTSPRIESK